MKAPADLDIETPCFREGEMLRINDWWFYGLGWRIHGLVEIKEGVTVGDGKHHMNPTIQAREGSG